MKARRVCFNLSGFFEALLDEERGAALISAEIETQLTQRNLSTAVIAWTRSAMGRITEMSLAAILRYSESPLETVFLRALVFVSLRTSWAGILIRGPFSSLESSLRTLGAELRILASLYHEFRSQERGGMSEFLSFLETDPAFSQTSRPDLEWWIFYAFVLEQYDRYQVILQPEFHGIDRDGRVLRPDLLFWMPAEPGRLIVLECDGYQVHGDRDAFRRDRVRDRDFLRNGIPVLRFSGQELYEDPLEAAWEVLTFLDLPGQKRNPPWNYGRTE